MTCNTFKEHIDSFIDGTLDDDIKAEMLCHAQNCSACKNELDDMQKIIGCLHTMPEISVPDDFLENLNNRIDNENIQIKKNNYRRFFNFRTYSAVAACILCVTIIKTTPQLLSFTDNNATEHSATSIIETLPLETSFPQSTTTDDSISSEYSTETVPSTITPQITTTQPVTIPTNQVSETPAPNKKVNEVSGIITTPNPNMQSRIIGTPAPNISVVSETPSIQTPASTDYHTTSDNPTNEYVDIPSTASLLIEENDDIPAAYSAPSSRNANIYDTDNTIYELKVNSADSTIVINTISQLGEQINNSCYRLNAVDIDKFFAELDKSSIRYTKEVINYSESDYIEILINFE